jgi:hypothetical protein
MITLIGLTAMSRAFGDDGYWIDPNDPITISLEHGIPLACVSLRDVSPRNAPHCACRGVSSAKEK